MTLTSGTRLGPYEIVGAAGAGGMGEVYRARDTRLNRTVAIKILPPLRNDDAEGRERLMHEAQAVGALNHPHICVLHDIGQHEGTDFLVMEYLDGETLAERLARMASQTISVDDEQHSGEPLVLNGRKEGCGLPLEEVVRYGIEIASALEEAHRHGISHGDLKPGNVMLTRSGMKLLDFGLARRLDDHALADLTQSRTPLTELGVIAGTLPYAAPEVLRGAPAGPRSDTWALGVVLYEMATGDRPFRGEVVFSLAAAILSEPHAPVPEHLPATLRSIIARCLSKDPADRYERAGEVRAALELVRSTTSERTLSTTFTHNLPLQLTTFLGRQRELTEITQLLDHARLVTLTGAGGSGKTRLALQAAIGVLPQFDHGMWFVDLAALTDPELIHSTIASTLGLREDASRSVRKAIVDHLKTRTVLLILDNCEHLIGACAELAGRLLTECPSLRILATSREALGVPGEHPWRTPSLSLPDPQRAPTVDSLLKSDAIRLFVERAAAAAPSFVMSAENASAVAHVCQRLDGIPLAIELAAARVKMLSVDQISARLDDRFRLLTGGSRTAMPRQQTLRAAIDWSYALLSDEERRLLRRLSVFTGGWTLEAAEFVCGIDRLAENDVLDPLGHLVDKSLVLVEGDPSGDRRYRLLETVRQYGRDRLLESGEAEQVRAWHLAFFRRLARAAALDLHGPMQVMRLNQLQVEHDNLREALEWCHGSEQEAETELELAEALWWFWNMRGYFSEGRQWLRRALSRGTQGPLRAKALAGAGVLAYFQGDQTAARSAFEESLALAGQSGDKPLSAFSLFGLGLVAVEEGDLAHATALAEQSQPIAGEVGDPWLSAHVPMLLGVVARATKDFERMRAHFGVSLALLRRVGAKWEIEIALSDMAEASLHLGLHDEAETMCREGLQLCQEVSDRRGIGWYLELLAAVAADQGQALRAARLFGAAETIIEATTGGWLPGYFRDTHERYVSTARRVLGAEVFDAAWAEGRAWRLDQALAYAVESESEPPRDEGT